jgi:glycosyltransferase involved in cell wall biosynthesis
MKIAIIHDWLYTYGGAEKVLEQIILCYPQADLYSLIDALASSERGFLQGKTVATSFLQNLPLAKTKHRLFLPLMPFAIEQFDLSAYDLVISSSYAVAKGVITGPNTLHICYCHTPIRYAWDMQGQYLQETGLSHGLKSWLVRYILFKIRLWDYRTANGVNYFIANSKFIAKRIYKVYRRSAKVIYPGVAVEKFIPNLASRSSYFFTASRLVPYKKISLIAQAFVGLPQFELVIAGIGPEAKKIKSIIANAPNIRYLGYLNDEELGCYLRQARAFVFAAEEDFGIMPLEAQACGTPVIALGRGGNLETVCAPATGLFFNQAAVADIQQAVLKFVSTGHITSDNCFNHAQRFSNERFRNEFQHYIEQCCNEFFT